MIEPSTAGCLRGVLIDRPDTRPEAHDHAIHHIFPRQGETGSTDKIIALIEGKGRNAQDRP